MKEMHLQPGGIYCWARVCGSSSCMDDSPFAYRYIGVWAVGLSASNYTTQVCRRARQWRTISSSGQLFDWNLVRRKLQPHRGRVITDGHFLSLAAWQILDWIYAGHVGLHQACSLCSNRTSRRDTHSNANISQLKNSMALWRGLESTGNGE